MSLVIDASVTLAWCFKDEGGSYATKTLRRVADSHAVTALVRVLSLFPIGSYVELSDGALARVIRSNGKKYAQPVVEVVHGSGDTVGGAVDGNGSSDIVDLAHSEIAIARAVPTPGESQIGLSPAWNAVGISDCQDGDTEGLEQAAIRILSNLDEFLQGGPVAKHGIYAFQHDQPAAVVSFHARQPFVEIAGIVMPETHQPGR